MPAPPPRLTSEPGSYARATIAAHRPEIIRRVLAAPLTAHTTPITDAGVNFPNKPYLVLRTHVVAADLNLEGVQQTAAAIIAQAGRRARTVQVDVTDEARGAAMVDYTIAEFGRLYIVVSNAGVLISGPADEFDARKWQLVIAVNLIGYFLVAKHAIRVMKPQRNGGTYDNVCDGIVFLASGLTPTGKPVKIPHNQ
ncbi:MAG TPA: SDR family oxidoreductase [Anaerolineae bacterium]|nr:SDR family oxidoreductase [Anaerolineae bacterium]